MYHAHHINCPLLIHCLYSVLSRVFKSCPPLKRYLMKAQRSTPYSVQHTSVMAPAPYRPRPTTQYIPSHLGVPTQASCVTAKPARTQSSAVAPPRTPYNYDAKRLMTSPAALLNSPIQVTPWVYGVGSLCPSNHEHSVRYRSST